MCHLNILHREQFYAQFTILNQTEVNILKFIHYPHSRFRSREWFWGADNVLVFDLVLTPWVCILCENSCNCTLKIFVHMLCMLLFNKKVCLKV